MLNEEVVTVVAESVPFWGTWTTVWSWVALAVLVVGVVISVIFKEADFLGSGVVMGVFIFIVGLLASNLGVTEAENNSLEKQLTQTVGIENLDYGDQSFTGSLDGRYVKGALVYLGGNEYQVVELATK